MILQLIARNRRLAELGLVDREQVDNVVGTRTLPISNDNGARSLGHALKDQHARKDRLAREMALKDRLIVADILDAGGGLFAIYIDNAIDHQERIAMRQASHQVDDFEAVQLPLLIFHLRSPLPQIWRGTLLLRSSVACGRPLSVESLDVLTIMS